MTSTSFNAAATSSSILSASAETPSRGWGLAICGVSLLIALPLITVISFVAYPAGDVWQHLLQTVLKDYVINSLLLAAGVAVGTTLIGVSTAWLTTVCDFPGRSWMTWALLLPLAMPAYIIAYTYTGMLDYAGPVQFVLREVFDVGEGAYWFPEIRSLGGAIVMLSLVLYPYVYLLARAAFLEQSVAIIDASRTLGYGPWASFFFVSVPIARPAIVAGVSLALMETLADYGTVQYFGISTFTTGIFRTWFGLGDTIAAAQLSALLMGFVLTLLVIERWSRSRMRFHRVGQRLDRVSSVRLWGWRSVVATLFCVLVLALGLLLPAVQLGIWFLRTAATMVDETFMRLVINTVSLAAITAIVTVGLSIFLGYGGRLHPTPLVRSAIRIAGMGYALPGTVIAVGVMLPFAWMDNALNALLEQQFGISPGLLLSGTLAALLFGYVVRFLAVSLSTFESGLSGIRPTMDDSARSLGYKPLALVWRIHVPLLRGSLLTAMLLVFVDVMKELPATLVLRPFNFNTLAVRAFELASDERLADSSTAALAIVFTGVIPVILLSRWIDTGRSVAAQ